MSAAAPPRPLEARDPLPRIPVSVMIREAPETAALLRALANPGRLVLLCRIAHDEVGVSALERDLGLSQPGLSQQLGELRRAGLVSARREGRAVLYRIGDARARAVIDMLHAIHCAPPEADAAPRHATPPTSAPPTSARPGDAARFARLDPPADGDPR